MSGGGWSAGLESNASGIQMDEFGVADAVQEFDGLGQQQYRRCAEQCRIRKRHDGADGAGIVGSLVPIMTRSGLYRRFSGRIGL